MTLPKLTAIGSGKGGTGKTLSATALASALAYQGERVLLCDCDLGLSNTTVHLGLDSGGDLAGLLSGRAILHQAVARVMGGAGERGGFDLIAAPSGSGALANLDQSVAEQLIAKLRNARSYDRVLMDLSAGIDATTMGFAARADETILVLTADPAALTDAYAFVKVLLRLGGRKPCALVNMADSEAEARRTRDSLAKTCRAFLKTSIDYLGFIPRDHHASMAIRQQRPLVALYPQSPSARAFERLADRLCEPARHGSAAESVVKLR
jgi:flagellar biosynthesis protein FlhG